MVHRDHRMPRIHFWVSSGILTFAATADHVKQDGTELAAHEAVDDDVDRRVDHEHQVDGSNCVAECNLGEWDAGVRVQH